MKSNDKIYVAGHQGLLGSAVLRALKSQGYNNIVIKTREQLDLCNQQAVNAFFEKEKPSYVFLCAGRVGGIQANKQHPADFIYENLMIQTNIIHAAYQSGVDRLVFFVGSCAYPRDCKQPMSPDDLWGGALEKTSAAYAVAKLAGIEACASYNKQYQTKFLAVLPANLYGPNDHADIEQSHVIPAMMHKMKEANHSDAPTVSFWGDGQQAREFLFSDDAASASLFLMNLSGESYNDLLTQNSGPVVNVGSGEVITIKTLAEKIKNLVGYKGDLDWDLSKESGSPVKTLDSGLMNSLGWTASVSLDSGLEATYASLND